MNADHAFLSGEVKRSVFTEMQTQQPSLYLHFFPVVCILICTFHIRGGGEGGEPGDRSKGPVKLIKRVKIAHSFL